MSVVPTECQCNSPGFCKLLRRGCDPKHGRKMSKVRHDECKNKPHYFEMFLGETKKPCHNQVDHRTLIESDWNCSPCKHLGETVETRICTTCGMRGESYVVRECKVHGQCSERKRDSRLECCLGCFEYEPRERPMPKWIYGITTVPERRETTFPQTLESLRLAGFDSPIVFCDGFSDNSVRTKVGQLGEVETVFRSKRLGAYGNFILSLWELYLRAPLVDRYAVFQDDIICSRNLRSYLDRQEFPKQGYWNLFTFMGPNEKIVSGKPPGWYDSDQHGRGGLALVFNREGVVQMLSAKCAVMKPQNVKFGNKKLDGAVVTALAPTHKQPGGVFKELIHNPSLVQHTGDISAIGHTNQPKALTFRGEDFDCLSLLSPPIIERKEEMYSPLEDVWVKVN